jgi:uncharacterized membrane protein
MSVALWLLVFASAVNAIAMVMNLRRASELDEFADVLLSDRKQLLEAARENAEASASLGIFVALNPIARLKTPSPEA